MITDDQARMQTFILAHDLARNRAMEAVKSADKGMVVVIREPSRNLEQNALMWPLLECFAKQKQWPVNGELVYMDAESWKDVLSAAFDKEEARIAKGIDGGVVMLGRRTRQFSKHKFSDWIEFLYATASHWGIDTKESTKRAMVKV